MEPKRLRDENREHQRQSNFTEVIAEELQKNLFFTSTKKDASTY